MVENQTGLLKNLRRRFRAGTSQRGTPHSDLSALADETLTPETRPSFSTWIHLSNKLKPLFERWYGNDNAVRLLTHMEERFDRTGAVIQFTSPELTEIIAELDSLSDISTHPLDFSALGDRASDDLYDFLHSDQPDLRVVTAINFDADAVEQPKRTIARRLEGYLRAAFQHGNEHGVTYTLTDGIGMNGDHGSIVPHIYPSPGVTESQKRTTLL